MTAYRLSAGGLVDRSKVLSFTFDGSPLRGLAGDTLASALLANDQMLVGRSFKYHRPRGIVSAGPSEPNALVTPGSGARSRIRIPRRRSAELYRRLDGEEPEPLAIARRSMSARSTACFRRFSAPASTTRPSCGPASSGKSFMSR